MDPVNSADPGRETERAVFAAPGAAQAMTTRTCLHCGDPLNPKSPANTKFCAKYDCQRERRNRNQRTYERQEKVCIHCGKPFLAGSKKQVTCGDPKCRYANSHNGHDRKGKAEVECLRCGRKFLTMRVGPTKIPRFRKCAECRRIDREEYRFVGVWG